MNEFKIPQISTLAGSTLLNFFKILKKGKVAPRFYFKIFLTTLIILIATPFHWWEEIFFFRKLSRIKFSKPPLFIIGHWRSGTTLLHNILCKDPGMGYMTTYQSVFPNNLSSKWIFKTFMRRNMPDKRPTDNVELNVNFPQEDEFAFSNSQAHSYYNFFYFPAGYKGYYDTSVYHKELDEKEIVYWFKSYDKMLKKALIDTKGTRLAVKNPVNTARIDKILKLYPDARFLYIYRNPVTVFYSTQHFFRELFPKLWLNPVDAQFIDNMIFEIYNRLMYGYQDQKSLIPSNNLMELRFEEFEQNPVEHIRDIYSRLLHEDFDVARPYFTNYFNSLAGYKKNRYSASQAMIDRIRQEWGYFMELYAYDIPYDAEIKEGTLKP